MTSPPDPRTYDFSDLVDAWREARRWKSAHPDLVKYHHGRHAAFAAAFGVDLDQAPKVAPPMPAWIVDRVVTYRGEDGLRDEADHWHEEIHRLALRADERRQSLSNPFSDYLEAPLAVIAANERFSSGISDRVGALRRELSDMVLELLRAVYPEAAGRTVSASQLWEHGFDAGSREPDPLDYW